MTRRKAAAAVKESDLSPESQVTVNLILLQRVEQNPGDSAFVLRLARALGLSSTVREVNRLNKFAQRKAG